MNSDNRTEWRNNKGELHRDGDLPAIIWANGTQEWYIDGKRHRNRAVHGDKPALIQANVREWYINGRRHRDGDKPAVIWADGTRMWYIYGKRHRDGDNPAIIWADGTPEWYKYGIRPNNKQILEYLFSYATRMNTRRVYLIYQIEKVLPLDLGMGICVYINIGN